ncbi:hypothetical protein D1872_266580 [compost metagenome]
MDQIDAQSYVHHAFGVPARTNHRRDRVRQRLDPDKSADDLQIVACDADLFGIQVQQPQEGFPKTDENQADENTENQVQGNRQGRDPARLFLPPRADILGYRHAGADSDKAEHQNAEVNDFVG